MHKSNAVFEFFWYEIAKTKVCVIAENGLLYIMNWIELHFPLVWNKPQALCVLSYAAADDKNKAA